MSGDMYEMVRKPRQRRDRIMPITLAAATIVIIACVIPVIWAGKYRRDFWNYIERLSNATVYAYEQGTLLAELEGEMFAIDGTGGYDIYNQVSGAGTGRTLSDPPQETPDLKLDYGNGTTLLMWVVPALKESNEGRTTDALLLFEDEEGSYCYRAWEVVPEKVLRIVSNHRID